MIALLQLTRFVSVLQNKVLTCPIEELFMLLSVLFFMFFHPVFLCSGVTGGAFYFSFLGGDTEAETVNFVALYFQMCKTFAYCCTIICIKVYNSNGQVYDFRCYVCSY